MQTFCHILDNVNSFKKQRKKVVQSELTTVTTATATTSSIQHVALNTQFKCVKCSYNHNEGSCPTYGKDHYNCSMKGYFTSMCRELRRQAISRKYVNQHYRRQSRICSHSRNRYISHWRTGQEVEQTAAGGAEATPVIEVSQGTTTEPWQG